MKSSFFKKMFLAIALALAFSLGIFRGHEVLAQSLVATTENLDAVGTTAGLSAQDPTIIVAKIIRAFLSVLGIIAIVLLMYGGFLWMTAGGDNEKVDRAKRLIINAAIGLTIILFSVGITQFVLQSIINSTGGGSGSSGSGSGSGGGGLGGGSSSVFEVTKHMPTGSVAIRNVVPQITFSKTLDASTISSENITFTYADGTEIPGALTATGNRVSFVPSTPCPAPNDNRFCFNESAVVNVSVSTDVKSSTGTVVSCANGLCSSTFTTGTLIDTENPVASLELPDDGAGVPGDSLIDVQVSATDDAQVAGADFLASEAIFDSVPASGPDLTNVLIETLWDTTGLPNGESYKLTATVMDIAGNTDSDSVTVEIRPITCFDGVVNGIETGPDCGGDSTSPDYCGACEGSSCTDGGECSSGFCEGGICVALPVIDSITPPSGAPGTWVTITGTHFGRADGTVFFTGLTGPVEAEYAPCADAWTDTQIIVTVPSDAIDGPITVTTFTGTSDETFDDNGPLIADFDVNSVAHPGLCSLAPTTGAPNDATTLSGTGFGASRASSKVLFGSAEAGSYSAWSQTAASVTVPLVPDGVYDVSVDIGGVTSNSIKFTVETDTLVAPSIVSVTPDHGGKGQYITISGTNFGTSTGTVWFEDRTSGVRLLADTESFPDACSSDYWSDQEITVIVPDGLALADYNLIVVAGEQESNAVNFTVTDESPTPGVCNVDPESGAVGDIVTFYGDNFGDTEGTVTFSASAGAVVEDWTDEAIVATVPTGSVTGAVVVSNVDAEESNPINFEISNSESVAIAGGLAAYAWSFSSGNIPSAPEIIFECSDARLSGVPNNEFDNGAGVCVNAAVFVEFTMPMNEPSMRGVTLAECTGGGSNPCSATAPVAGTWTTSSLSVTFTPSVSLKTSTTYMVSVPDTVLSDDGVPVANAQDWSFTTRSDSSACRLEKVVVSPDAATITALNATQDFTSMPALACTVLSSSGFTWSWSVNPSYARINSVLDPTCKGGSTNCALTQALAEGVTPVTARETASAISDSSTLTIDFSDPYITNYWPNCTEACTNAEVGASFNIAMDERSVQTIGAVKLYSCVNELCTSLTPMAAARASCTLDAAGECSGFRMSGVSLATGKFYRVVVAGTVKSTSGVSLTRTNYAGNFSWTFRVRDDGALCAVERITLSPEDAVVENIGAHQTYTTEAFGVADSCSVSGQRLSGFAYDWGWTDPIADEDIDNNTATRVAEWSGMGLVDTDPDDIPLGCTTACTAIGSLPHSAICGDGSIDYGEECEDGNVANGDGCSASCLREASTSALCGNGVVTRAANGTGEDCDDGNTLDGDGCSAGCLAEGSSSVGATCGNSDIAVIDVASNAGEECDDGNASSGDGCSRECLFEGSPTLAEIGGAVCGNGGFPEAPAEECDDNNTVSGDGCSSECLLEGSSLVYGSTCGLNGIEFGEACDDGNTVSGDGCSSECLLEGSSPEYVSPSFCGDGFIGTGEVAACEVGVTGDGNTDPLQVAVVPEDAALEVDPNTQRATATIEVAEMSSGLSTQATLALLCVAETDSQCQNPDIYGVSDSNCCMLRPEATLFPNGEDTCRNGAIYAIFTSQMDLGDFTYEASEGGATVTKRRMYARLDLGSTADGLCPSDHTTLALEKRTLLNRVWQAVMRFVRGRNAKADTGDCVAPITSFVQTALSDGTYKVQMHVGALLAPNANYELVVEGDNDISDNIVSGVRNTFGVGMNGTHTQGFTTGDEICALDAIQVIDTNADSPNVFTQGDEQHTFAATALSYSTGIPQEIDSIPGVYSWDWTGWKAAGGDKIVNVEQLAAPDTATVTAVGENGNDIVLATATIKDNTAGISTESEVSGEAQLTAFLCENPWPGVFADLPWSDTADGDIGAEEGSGWMNFSTMYCRDAGEPGTAGDLSDLVVVRPPLTESENVIKEYLFEVAGGPDAIGIRVASNASYLSPEAWYESQGFTGDPSSTEIDGYSAIKDGRTTYVVAPNQTATGELYTNIYVISYNEGASDETIEIYDQILANFRFAVNISDAPVCDTDEPACDSSNDKLRRDVQRLIDMTDTAAFVNEYEQENGVVPVLPAGTFVRSLSSSVWESWDGLLGGALGESNLPADPINNYVSCGATGYEAYDAETCVNQTLGTYVCPAGSHTYHYRAVGNGVAWLYADLEYTVGTWVNDIEQVADSTIIAIGNASSTASGFNVAAFCDGTNIWGSSATCGDGVIGSDETCELGQLGGGSSVCSTSDGLTGDRSQACNSTCTGFVDDLNAACIVASCGNGVQDVGEDCDDGSFNGRYGFCGADCSDDSRFYCGDGQLAGGETCDCGVSVATRTADSRAYGSVAGSCGLSLNGVYASSPNASCAWDCSGPAAYCGDNTVDSGEVCDGSNQTWSGKLCDTSSSAGLVYQPCFDDSECGGGSCGGGGSLADCPFGTTRVMTCDDAPGATCTYTNPDWSTIACTEIGSCGDGTVDPDEECDDGNLDGTDDCTDQCKLNVCGDARVFVGQEQCDEGVSNGAGCSSAYGSSCTACSLSCRYQVSSGDYCGDGEINGPEFCDATAIPLSVADKGVCNGGNDNGVSCSVASDCDSGSCIFPACGNTCMSTCPAAYASAPLKMITNQPGAKLLDSANLYSFVDSSTSAIPNTATLTIPACTVASGLTASVSMDGVDLPTTYVLFVTDLSLTMKYVPDAKVEPDLTDDDESNDKSRLDIAKQAVSDAAERLFDEFGDKVQVGAIGYRGLSFGECFYDARVDCLTDFGIVGVPSDALCADTGFDGDRCNLKSSSIDESDLANPIITSEFGYKFDFIGPEGESDLRSEIEKYTYDYYGLNGSADKDGHGTFTYEALVQAKNMFDEIKNSAAGDNARYIAIVLSDGQVNDFDCSDDVCLDREDGSVSQDPLEIAEDFDSYIPGKAGYEVYSATIGSSISGGADNMNYWSGNSYDGELDSYACDSGFAAFGFCPHQTSTLTGLDYAYDGDNETEMLSMYDAIVDSITALVVTLVAKDPDRDPSDQFVTTQGIIHEGNSLTLPWPEGFKCDPDAEQYIPVKIQFPGEGQIKLSNVLLDYCSP